MLSLGKRKKNESHLIKFMKAEKETYNLYLENIYIPHAPKNEIIRIYL